MHRGYRIVAFIPAGRRRTMELLLHHLDATRPSLLDEIQIWLNTRDPQEVAWLRGLTKVRLVEFDHKRFQWMEPVQKNTSLFYQMVPTTDPKTIYVRFDDDILWLEKNALRNLVDFRIDNPQYFLVFANIWNNATLSYIHQQAGRIGLDCGKVVGMNCMDPVGWKSPQFGEYVHRLLLDHIKARTEAALLFTPPVRIPAGHRFSISCFAFFGADFAPFAAKVENAHFDEEIFLTIQYPKQIRRDNVICGTALVSHFTFFTQRQHILRTDILARYREVATWYPKRA
jgi:hypothetical protein